MAQRFGDVDCRIAGRTLTLRYGGLAWDNLFRYFKVGTPFGCMLKAQRTEADFLILVREGLLTYHPDITLEEVRALYDEIPQEGETRLGAAAHAAVALGLPELRPPKAESADPKADAVPSPSPKTRRRSSKKR